MYESELIFFVSICTGHFIFECKSSRPYITRPSRTKQLENPELLAKLSANGKPSVEVPEEFKNKLVYLSYLIEVIPVFTLS